MEKPSTPHRWNNDSILRVVYREIEESIATKRELKAELANEIAEVASLLVERLNTGHKLIAFGNGGSAADAQHLVAELVGRYQAERKALAAVTLTANSSSLTAIGNDYGFENVFSRQLEAIAKPGDVALAISTSGNSANVLLALETAKNLGLAAIGLSGKTGGKMRPLVDICLRVPSGSTPRIQEVHTLIIHILSKIVEKAFLPTAFPSESPNGATVQK
jgi:D-sedoheptulose 7-phosphate isomerase